MASINLRKLGTLFMDLDALSGVVVYKHTGDSVMTVTAAVDRITIKHPLKELCDLELSGQVTFATGRSSMEISLQVARAPDEGRKARPEDVLMTCAFTMVSLDPATKKPVPIAPCRLTRPRSVDCSSMGRGITLPRRPWRRLRCGKLLPMMRKATSFTPCGLSSLNVTVSGTNY